jgi:hypothetical protein
MSHLITTVNNQTPNVNGAITSNASPFSYFFIGNQYALLQVVILGLSL